MPNASELAEHHETLLKLHAYWRSQYGETIKNDYRTKLRVQGIMHHAKAASDLIEEMQRDGLGRT